MDISFKTENGKFNYRVCAVIINGRKLLAMHDEHSPYYYLPGGRVSLHETAENAILRELKEELEIEAKIIRPLWVNQGFFIEDATGEKFHEICIYFLIDVSHTDLLNRGDKFRMYERHHIHDYEWLAFERLKDEYLYPLFIKEKIFNLPDTLVLQTEFE
ncbi:MAG: NUDIX domain-containing protein [Clostridiales bacterium]|nr:NUDIX domain-containing protein [Clostridiales bacterium]